MIAVDANLLVYAHREDSPFEAWIGVKMHGEFPKDLKYLWNHLDLLEDQGDDPLAN